MTKQSIYYYLERLQLSLTMLSIASLPWYVIRFNVANIPLTLVEVIAWLSIGLWVMLRLLRRQSWHFKPIPRWTWLAIVWLVAAAVGVLISPDIKAALGIFKAYFVLPVMFAAMLYHLIDTPKKLYLVLCALVISALQIAILCLTQWGFNWPDFAHQELAQGRSSAVFNSANAVGLAVGPVIAIISAFLLFKRPLSKQRLAGGWLVVCCLLLGLYTSRSDGATVAVIGVYLVLVLGYVFNQTRHHFKHLSSLSLGLLTIYALSTILYMGWFNHPPTVANPYTRPNFTTLTIRQCTWQGAWASLQHSPLMGNGLAGFSQAYLKHATCDAEPFVYPHNIILNVWTELGLAGLVVWLMISAVWLTTAAELIRANDHTWSWLGWAVMTALCYWLIHGLVDVPYFKNDLSMMWWIILASTLTGLKIYRHNPKAANL